MRARWERFPARFGARLVAEHFDTLLAAGRVVARTARAGRDVSALREAVGDDVDSLLRTAERHGMVPILCSALEAHAAESMSAHARDLVARERQLASARALGAVAQLGIALDALGRAGIRALPLKGPVLSLAAYGDAGLRSSDDIDVLVGPSELDRAWEALRAVGYRVKQGWTWGRWRAANAWQGQAALLTEEEGLMLDLHWRTCDEKLPWDVPFGDLWATARHVDLSGRSVAAPDSAGQLLLTLLHAARHGWDRLEYLVSAAALIRRSDAPERLEAVLRRPGTRRAVTAGLHAVALLLDESERTATSYAAIPEMNAEVHGLAAAALRRVRAGDAGSTRSQRLHLRSLDSLIDRARYLALAALQPTATDYEWMRLPDAFRFVYPLVRVARLLARR
jgi:hypothetical protein